jgi:hypothetical protein
MDIGVVIDFLKPYIDKYRKQSEQAANIVDLVAFTRAYSLYNTEGIAIPQEVANLFAALDALLAAYNNEFIAKVGALATIYAVLAPKLELTIREGDVALISDYLNVKGT